MIGSTAFLCVDCALVPQAGDFSPDAWFKANLLNHILFCCVNKGRALALFPGKFELIPGDLMHLTIMPEVFAVKDYRSAPVFAFPIPLAGHFLFSETARQGMILVKIRYKTLFADPFFSNGKFHKVFFSVDRLEGGCNGRCSQKCG